MDFPDIVSDTLQPIPVEKNHAHRALGAEKARVVVGACQLRVGADRLIPLAFCQWTSAADVVCGRAALRRLAALLRGGGRRRQGEGSGKQEEEKRLWRHPTARVSPLESPDRARPGTQRVSHRQFCAPHQEAA
jgi:hypothetical protein